MIYNSYSLRELDQQKKNGMSEDMEYLVDDNKNLKAHGFALHGRKATSELTITYPFGLYDMYVNSSVTLTNGTGVRLCLLYMLDDISASFNTIQGGTEVIEIGGEVTLYGESSGSTIWAWIVPCMAEV